MIVAGHWVPSRGRSESAALGVCVYIKTYTHTPSAADSLRPRDGTQCSQWPNLFCHAKSHINRDLTDRDMAQWLERGALPMSMAAVRFRIPLGAEISE